METAAFTLLVARILERYRRQNGLPLVSEEWSQKIGERLVALIAERGLPRCLRPDERGEPGEMSADEVTPLVTRVLGGATAEGWENPVRQLVKTCIYPEFKKCRDSYREVEATGACRRQMLTKVRSRVSGAHCVDCPYWTSLTEAQDEALVASAWVGDLAEFKDNREIFLPDDFREFRRLVRRWAKEEYSDESR